MQVVQCTLSKVFTTALEWINIWNVTWFGEHKQWRTLAEIMNWTTEKCILTKTTFPYNVKIMKPKGLQTACADVDLIFVRQNLFPSTDVGVPLNTDPSIISVNKPWLISEQVSVRWFDIFAKFNKAVGKRWGLKSGVGRGQSDGNWNVRWLIITWFRPSVARRYAVQDHLMRTTKLRFLTETL